MNNYSKKNHKKFLIKYHIIFVVKYRKKLLVGKLKWDMNNIMRHIAISSDFDIDEIQSDENHIHILVNSVPKISPTSIISRLKQQSTVDIWKNHTNILSNHFWKEQTFWSDGYFVCSVGNASIETIKKYIENQG